MHSMTGFAKKIYKNKDFTIDLEIKTVNHRFLAIRCDIPRMIEPYESRIKDMIKKRIKRGTTMLKINIDAKPTILYKPDIEALMNFYKDLLEIKEQMGIKEQIGFETLHPYLQAFMPKTRKSYEIENIAKATIKLLRSALFDLVKMRKNEGAKIKKELLKMLSSVERLIKKIQKRKDKFLVDYARALRQKIKELSNASGIHENVNGRMIAKEVVIYAERSDVTEECQRIVFHLKQFKSAISERSQVGKKLEFLISEMTREINTLLSKALDARISHYGIMVKLELEKMREHAENIE
jgi:uncharacterized protein (TIGR00255 family)